MILADNDGMHAFKPYGLNGRIQECDSLNKAATQPEVRQQSGLDCDSKPIRAWRRI